MIWTVLAVIGMACLVAAAVLAFGIAAGLLTLGLSLLAVAIDGRN